MRLVELERTRVAIWGFGREGRAAYRLLRETFFLKPLTLFASGTEALQAETLDDPHLKIVRESPDVGAVTRCDVLIKSPGVSAYLPVLLEAQAAGVVVTSGSALWFAEHRAARSVCVTGTKGKSTTSALLAHLLRSLGRRTALAGNIGLPLLDLFDPRPHTPEYWAIELSSFQTRDFDGAPSVALVLNLFPEHLDWHGTEERYYADKLAILDRAEIGLINADNATLCEATRGRPGLRTFGDPEGWHVADGWLRRGARNLLETRRIPLPGAHNAQNACGALAAIELLGEDAIAAVPHLLTFEALPHRLQPLGVVDGIEYVNDSISTTPHAARAALECYAERNVVLLVGGHDRGVSWEGFDRFVRATPPHAIIAMGANRQRIAAALRAAGATPFALFEAADLPAAMAAARQSVPSGGVILLSPGAPSFGEFRDYAERGKAFAALAGFDPASIASIQGLGI